VRILSAELFIAYDDNNEKYILLSFGWDVISCKYVESENAKLGVNPLIEDNVVSCIRKAKKENSNARIIVLPHWDYELEKYPMPMHRELARKMIDEGAFAVIGHHTHCVQQFEWYKDKLIFYSLGNWFIPSNVYMGGKLRYPEYSNYESALELETNGIYLHRFKYSPDDQALYYIKTEYFRIGEMDPENPYYGMDKTDYLKWFKQNRIKRKLLPVFSGRDTLFVNRFRAAFVKERQKVVSILRAGGRR